MAKVKVPYFTSRARVGGGLLYYWQPNKALRDLGFKLKRLSDDLQVAIAEAQAENARAQQAREDPAAASLRATAKEKGRIDPGSVEAMIRAFRKSDEFTGLADKTQIEYETAMKALSLWAGDQPKAAINAAMAKQWVKLLATKIVKDTDGTERVVHRPATAKSIGRVVRRIWYWDKGSTGKFKSAGEEAANPFARLGLTYKRDNIKDPEQLLWTDAAITAFVEQADILDLHSVGTAIMLDAWLGQRMGDVIAWPLDFDADIRSRQSKRGRRVILPVGRVPHLHARIAAERLRIQARQAETKRVQETMRATGRNAWPAGFTPTLEATTLLVSEATGLPYSVDHFGAKFDKVRAAVVAAHPDQPHWPDLTFQRLRATAVTRLAEAGATDEEVAAISGHSLATVKEILEFYLVRTRKMAVNAFKKRMAADAAGGED